MKAHIVSRRPLIVAAAVALSAFHGVSLHGQHTWQPTTGGTHSWSQPTNWDPNVSYPSFPGDQANVNIDITGTQTINLGLPIALGTLNLGDADGSHGITIASGAGVNTLMFDSGNLDVPAQIVMSSGVSGGTSGSTISAPIALGTDLIIDLGSSTRGLTLSGGVDTGIGIAAAALMITGGTAAVNQLTVSGDITGAGVITNNSNAAMIFNGTKSFTGTFVLNSGRGGSNTGSITLTNGSIANAAEVVINGYLTNGVTQNGGSVHSGSGSGMGTNPGQRLTQHRIILNGGSLSAVGQPLNGDAAGTLVQDNVATLTLGAGYSVVSSAYGNGSGGTLLNVGTLERSPGTTLYVRSTTLGLETNGSRVLVGNIEPFLVGADGAEGSTTMSIVPWMVANNGGASTGIPTGFATYTATGIRALTTGAGGEYASSITAGDTTNVSVGSFNALSSPTTVNSLRLTGSGGTAVSTIGTGQTLTVASGGLFLASNGTTLGQPGNENAGTVDFGAAEAVIWSNGSNTNTIGASITGTGGLTKSGTGTLILAGVANDFLGTTYVAGGTLQVGDGINGSTLGLSDDIAVAAGSVLFLNTPFGNMLQDDAVLRLEQYGLFNGKLMLAADVNEEVTALFLGDLQLPAGTYTANGTYEGFDVGEWISGPGAITVIPEPASATMLLCGLGAILARRRRS